jgi:hypothetical protein
MLEILDSIFTPPIFLLKSGHRYDFVNAQMSLLHGNTSLANRLSSIATLKSWDHEHERNRIVKPRRTIFFFLRMRGNTSVRRAYLLLDHCFQSGVMQELTDTVSMHVLVLSELESVATSSLLARNRTLQVLPSSCIHHTRVAPPYTSRTE